MGKVVLHGGLYLHSVGEHVFTFPRTGKSFELVFTCMDREMEAHMQPSPVILCTMSFHVK